MAIPRIIHQVWLGSDDPPVDWMQTWVDFAHHAGWEYRVWTESTIPPLENYKQYDYYLDRELYHGASDVARIEILEQFGGWYVDADLELIDPTSFAWDPMHEAAFVVSEHPNLNDRYPNTVIGSIPGSRILSRYVDMVSRCVKMEELEPVWRTVGALMYPAVHGGTDPFHVVPARMFLPFQFGRRTRGDSPVYAIHHQMTTRTHGMWDLLPEYREEDL